MTHTQELRFDDEDYGIYTHEDAPIARVLTFEDFPYVDQEGEQMIDDDAKIKGRLLVAAYNSYGKHFGPRAVEAAEADLLGEALAIVEAFEDVYRNGYPEGERAVEVANRARYLLSKSKGVGK
jgi:hypothetical protein